MKDKIIYDYTNLRMIICTNFKSEREFAKTIGCSINYLSDVFEGIKYFSTDDIKKGVEVLKLSPEQMQICFFKTI